MFDKILKLIEEHPSGKKPSYYDRLISINKFMQRHDLYKEMYPEQPREPISIVWAVSSKLLPEVFFQQLGSLLQLDGLLQPDDEIVFVGDSDRREDVESAKIFVESLKVKAAIIRRDFPGDGPAPNWDVGVGLASYDRVLFTRDVCLFYTPWELFSFIRGVKHYKGKLINFSTVLGPVWSRYSDRCLFLAHPRFSPSPFLLTFLASRADVLDIGGFDPILGRGFDHTGEVDFLLRWATRGYSYEITEDVHVFHPGITANSQEELNEMQFQSSINRRYFFDRYGDDFIDKLKPPYKADIRLMEVNHALTYDPLTEVDWNQCDFVTGKRKEFSKVPVEWEEI